MTSLIKYGYKPGPGFRPEAKHRKSSPDYDRTIW